MGIEKLTFTARYEAKNLQLIDDLQETCFPLASKSAVANQVFTLFRMAVEEGVIDPSQVSGQQMLCGKRTRLGQRTPDQRGLVLAWMLQIVSDPQVQIAGPHKYAKPAESKVKRAS